MLRRLALIALLLSTPALAQSYGREDTVRGLCQPDGCDEFAVLGAERVATAEDGSLFRTRLKTFQASSAGRKDLGEEHGYVYCSSTKPAVLADQDGRTAAFLIAPFGTESREAIRKNANYHAVYFAICHGLEAGRAAVRDLPGVAQNLGYRVPLTQSRLVSLNRPEEILSSRRQPVASRPEPGSRAEPASRAEALLPPREVPSAEAGRSQTLAERLDEPSARRLPSRQAPPPPPAASPDPLAVPRQLTDRALDALDTVGSWVLGR